MELQLGILKQVLGTKYEENQMRDAIYSNAQNFEILPRQTHEARQGDWICMRCNNLNFSFRKKCNRCKIQTRQQNDHNLRQAYHYYQQYYSQSNEQGYPLAERNIQSEQNQHTYYQNPQLPHQFIYEEVKTELSQQRYLPSVSPIVKRYTKQKTTPLTEISDDSSSEEQQILPQQFLLQYYCWQNILIDEEIQNQMSSKEYCDFWDYQIEKLVQSIVI